MNRDQIKNCAGRVIGTELFVPDVAKLASLYDAKGFSVTRERKS
jgi:hypothetical protein